MKKLITSILLLGVCGAVNARTVEETITVDNFHIKGATLALDNMYGEGEFTSQQTGVSYFCLARRATPQNGGGLEIRGRSDSGVVITDNPYGYTISAVRINRYGADEPTNTVDVYTSDKAYTSSANLYEDTAGTLQGSIKGLGEGSVDLPADIEFIGIRPDMNSVYLTSVTIVYEVPESVADRKQADLSFPSPSYTVKLGEEFSSPVLTKATDMPAVFTSSDPEVAAVGSESGIVEIKGAGICTITATCEASDEYFAGTARYLLTVIDPEVQQIIYESSLMSQSSGFEFKRASGPNPWQFTDFGLSASGYIKDAVTATDAWAIYPGMDLKGYHDVILSFDQRVDDFRRGSELIDITELDEYVSIWIRENGSEEWLPMPDVKAPEAFGRDYYNSGQIKLNDLSGKEIDIGFHYVSTTEVAGTWTITNLHVTGLWDGNDAVNEIGADFGKEARYYDLQGRQVKEPASGIYIRIKDGKADKCVIRK